MSIVSHKTTRKLRKHTTHYRTNRNVTTTCNATCNILQHFLTFHTNSTKCLNHKWSEIYPECSKFRGVSLLFTTYCIPLGRKARLLGCSFYIGWLERRGDSKINGEVACWWFGVRCHYEC